MTTVTKELEQRYNTVHEAIMGGEWAELQNLIDSGQAWRLEGSVGRAASAALDEGACVLPLRQAHADYWGNIVPAVAWLEDGTKGTVGNAERYYDL